jgi:hypothetical protein
MPWTIHLDGIAGILREQGVLNTSPTDEWRELVTSMGVLDLPTHTLGRRGKHLHLWYKHCRNKDGIDDSTGLPCSLIHLLASVMEPEIKDRILQWSGWPRRLYDLYDVGCDALRWGNHDQRISQAS